MLSPISTGLGLAALIVNVLFLLPRIGLVRDYLKKDWPSLYRLWRFKLRRVRRHLATFRELLLALLIWFGTALILWLFR